MDDQTAKDLMDATRLILEPNQGASWSMCPECGVIRDANQPGHVCRTEPLEIPGMVADNKRRAKSYAVD